MEKLGQLRSAAETTGEWDLIIVDTPPSRSALDFLDAPKRLGSFLDGRLMKLLSAPARGAGKFGAKVVGASLSVVTGTLTKVIGAQVLKDLQTFVSVVRRTVRRIPPAGRGYLRPAAGPDTRFLVVAALNATHCARRRISSSGQPARTCRWRV